MQDWLILVMGFVCVFCSVQYGLALLKSHKLKARPLVDVVNLEIMFEGAVSILDSNNPLMVYEKLSSYIPRRLRVPMKRRVSGGG